MTTANERRKTKRRQIAIPDDQWDRLEELVGDRGRSALVQAFVDWYLRVPGAKLPPRPPTEPDHDPS